MRVPSRKLPSGETRGRIIGKAYNYRRGVGENIPITIFSIRVNPLRIYDGWVDGRHLLPGMTDEVVVNLEDRGKIRLSYWKGQRLVLKPYNRYTRP